MTGHGHIRRRLARHRHNPGGRANAGHRLGRFGRRYAAQKDVDIAEEQAILELKWLIDTATALRQCLRSADLPTRNLAAELEIRAQRKAGQSIGRHPESLE
jgi:hypothetical protein